MATEMRRPVVAAVAATPVTAAAAPADLADRQGGKKKFFFRRKRVCKFWRREARVHRLQRHQDAAAVHPGAGEDPSAPHLRNVCSASAQTPERDQARPHRGHASVRD